MSAIDIDNLRQWIGRERTVPDALSLFPAQALAAALDHPHLPEAGDALPPAWQWLYFLEVPRASSTGADGHPALGGFLPPVPLPRRMWAASDFKLLHPLRLGEAAQRSSVITSVEAKTGKSGTLVFVTLQHRLTQAATLCIQEEQSLVYREAPTSAASPASSPASEPAPLEADWTRVIHPDPVLLFRYSALTYNSHRIHYDRPYALTQESYPALVVHGPLLATLLLDLLHEQLSDASIASFRFRAMRPTFDNAPFSVSGRQQGNSIALWTTDYQGQIGMSATASLSS